VPSGQLPVEPEELVTSVTRLNDARRGKHLQ
jgi:hypothetical protein